MKHKGVAALVLVSALLLMALIPSAFAAAPASDGNTETRTQETQNSRQHSRHGCNGKTAEPENAIGKEAAKAEALADADVTVEQAGKVKTHISQLDDGTVIYKVCFTCGDTHYAYQINAISGAVINKSAESVTENTAANSRRHGKRSMGKGSKSANAVTETTSVVV